MKHRFLIQTLPLAIMAFFLAAGFSLQAQPGGGGRMMNPEQRAEQQAAQMTEQLGLSEAQTVKVKEIHLKYAKQSQEAREKAAGDREAMRETMTALRQEQDKELQTVVTTEQWEKWTKFREEQRANRGNWGGGAPPSGDKTAPTDETGKKSKKEKKSKKSKTDSDDKQ